MPCGRAPQPAAKFCRTDAGPPLTGRSPACRAADAHHKPSRHARPLPRTDAILGRAGSGRALSPGAPRQPPRRKPKLKKLRLAFILLGISRAGARLDRVRDADGGGERPALAREPGRVPAAENSVLYADGPGLQDPARPCQIAKLTGNQNRILLEEGEISPNIKNAVIAIEDRRFYEHEGVDYTGIARALWQDVLKRPSGAGRLDDHAAVREERAAAQGNRSVFQKLRESALAYHLERQWSKEKILTQYLNTVYFGNGAYGIEAAVRTYFGDGDEPEEQQGAEPRGVQYAPPTLTGEEEDPNARLANDVTPDEAALLAGMISSPSLYDPLENPQNALERRNLVLQRMYEQRMITARSTRSRSARRSPTRTRSIPARLRVGAALLHELDDPAARRPLQDPGWSSAAA